MNVRAFLVAGLSLVLLGLSACASPAVTRSQIPAAAQTGPRVWVLDSGWHTGLVLPRRALGPALSALLKPASQARYFMFGWGNRKYYMAPAATLGMDLETLFPSKSVVLVETCADPPRTCYTSAVKFHVLRISADGLRNLDGYLLQSLKTDARGQLEALAPGPDPDSEFYASGLSYDMLHTCNTWTAEALNAVGVPLNNPHVIFADQLWRQLGDSPR